VRRSRRIAVVTFTILFLSITAAYALNYSEGGGNGWFRDTDWLCYGTQGRTKCYSNKPTNWHVASLYVEGADLSGGRPLHGMELGWSWSSTWRKPKILWVRVRNGWSDYGYLGEIEPGSTHLYTIHYEGYGNGKHWYGVYIDGQHKWTFDHTLSDGYSSVGCERQYYDPEKKIGETNYGYFYDMEAYSATFGWRWVTWTQPHDWPEAENDPQYEFRAIGNFPTNKCEIYALW